MTLRESVKTIGKKLSGIFFPEGITCLSCGDEIPSGTVCGNCGKKITLIEKACEKCGCEIFAGNYCVRCKNASFGFEKCVSACSYGGFVKSLVFRFKTGDKYLSRLFSELLANKIKESGISFDLIACVPVTAGVLRKRGYNQSALIASGISEKLGVPFIPDLLIKVKDTDFQKNLSAAERRVNVKGAYRVNRKSEISGKTVLIVDDVITTGSTLSECSEVLLKVGAKKAFCAAFAAVSLPISFDNP